MSEGRTPSVEEMQALVADLTEPTEADVLAAVKEAYVR